MGSPCRRWEGNTKENLAAGEMNTKESLLAGAGRGIHRRIFPLGEGRGIRKIRLRIINPNTLSLGIANPQQQQRETRKNI